MEKCETCQKEMKPEEVTRDIFGRVECLECFDAATKADKIDSNHRP